MNQLSFDNGAYQILARPSTLSNTFVEVVVYHRNIDEMRSHYVETVRVDFTESVQDVFDRVVKKYTQP